MARHIRARNRVGDACERNLRALVLDEQRLFHDVALDRVTESAQQASRIDLSFDEVVLRSLLEGQARHLFVIETGQYDQRNARGRGACASYRFDTVRVRQPEIQEDDIDDVRREMRFSLRHRLHVDEVRGMRAALVQHLAQQPGIAEVVLDEEKAGDLPEKAGDLLCHSLFLCCGSFTFVSQKSLMLLTRFSNASSCTGLVR